MKTVAYIYFMKDEPEKIAENVRSHVDYWKKSNLDKYVGGPFADRSGGMIFFETENLYRATEIIDQDPFILHDLIESKWIKEWRPE